MECQGGLERERALMRMMQKIGSQLGWGDWAGNFAYPGLSFPICQEK